MHDHLIFQFYIRIMSCTFLVFSNQFMTFQMLQKYSFATVLYFLVSQVQHYANILPLIYL